MSLLCRLGHHRSEAPGVWNDGLYFGRCGRCGEQLIRRPDQAWTRVPQDYVVVWADRRPQPTAR
ncbi:hypothetical protein SAMN06295912_107152 [Sphingomonas laterariae]|uniref:Uncharacterized protein n=1 Tax=Edaphosphingomonas laterariae TaxID=861865 RepID=A0A239EX55_9SPHN|nr:hypothetical protein [Sphingomonas laterariae]SNS49185.1 hypothetical protein SAMN06295912_107152 [Sphingomonas laterariae]